MPSLDGRGDVAIGILVVYPFVFLLSLILIIRHGIRRHRGWLFLFIFSIVRIVGGILRIVAGKRS